MVYKKNIFLVVLLFFIVQQLIVAQPIDRKALVERHIIKVNAMDSLSSLSVGNGGFAFNVDGTGLQTFPDAYAHGVSLGTQSTWGWHSFPNTHNYRFEEALKTYHLNGSDVTYAVQFSKAGRDKEAADYFRQNPHRLQLGNIGFEITKKDGSAATITDIRNVNQQLNMWTGEILSRFTIEKIPVVVITYAHQQQDVIAVAVKSPLLSEGRLKLRIRFPYPTGEWFDAGNNWKNEDKHQSSIAMEKPGYVLLKHTVDTTSYYTALNLPYSANIQEKQPHYFIISPARSASFSMTVRFDEKQNAEPVPPVNDVLTNSINSWAAFWKNGAVVDFKGSKDKRAFELERRIICSQYLTKIQCAGDQPPQETGLTYNSWYGKPHLEMHWWHGVHFPLWNRAELLEKSLAWYFKTAHYAYDIAKRQGYKGLRWQKMTDNEGRETPSSIGAMLIWQQPHFIYMAELIRRDHNDQQTIDRYKDLVFATADFMADFAYFDSASNRYILGPGVIPAQERFKPDSTFNPTYELVYWQWALSVAQQWREMAGLPRVAKWQDVINKLSPLPVQNGLYLPAESAVDGYANPVYRTDHPSVLGAFGMMPLVPGTDTAIVRKTFNWIWQNWTWPDTWGWDFPMVAMTATRLGMPEKAIDALFMPVRTNTWLVSGHNYQDERLTIYLPGNGGLLTAIAMMVGGYDACKGQTPGIPKNGQWQVKWEGLEKMP